MVGIDLSGAEERTGNLAFTSSKAFPDTPPETLNSSYVWTVRTPAARLFIGAPMAEERERRRVIVVESCMMFKKAG
jgi:hypothetical protein